MNRKALAVAGIRRYTSDPERGRIDLRDAIAAFTLNAAYVIFQDDRTESIEVAKLADQVFLGRILFAIHPAEISETKVLLPFLGGKPVYGDLKEPPGLDTPDG